MRNSDPQKQSEHRVLPGPCSNSQSFPVIPPTPNWSEILFSDLPVSCVPRPAIQFSRNNILLGSFPSSTGPCSRSVSSCVIAASLMARTVGDWPPSVTLANPVSWGGPSRSALVSELGYSFRPPRPRAKPTLLLSRASLFRW